MAIKLDFEKRIQAKPEQIFFAFTNKTGMREWFADIVEFNEDMSKSFVLTWNDGKSIFGTIIEKVENERILFEVLTAEKHRRFDIEVLIEEEEEATLVKIESKGVLEEDQDKVEDIWVNALENLKSIIEDGIDMRIYKKPMLGIKIGELINPEIAKRKGYPIEYGFVIPKAIEGLGAQKAGVQPGDIMAEVDGKKVIDFDVLSALATAKAGDVLKTIIYRGEERLEIYITLSYLPTPDLPASAQDLSDNIEKIYKKNEIELNSILADVSENAAEYRPAPGEWNIKEIIAHLILTNRDLFYWAASLVAGKENTIFTSVMPEKSKSVIASYPAMYQLCDELRKVRKENIAFLSEIPLIFTTRKCSFMRLSENVKQEQAHYVEHVEQIKTILEKAANI